MLQQIWALTEVPILFQPFQIRRKALSMRNSHAWLNPPRPRSNKRGKSCRTASHRWTGFFVDKGVQNSIYRWQSRLWLSSIKASLLRAVLGPWENIWAAVCGACTTIHVPPSLQDHIAGVFHSSLWILETPLLWGHTEDVTCMSCSAPRRPYSLKE